jgi:hypothetical protein
MTDPKFLEANAAKLAKMAMEPGTAKCGYPNCKSEATQWGFCGPHFQAATQRGWMPPRIEPDTDARNLRSEILDRLDHSNALLRDILAVLESISDRTR